MVRDRVPGNTSNFLVGCTGGGDGGGGCTIKQSASITLVVTELRDNVIRHSAPLPLGLLPPPSVSS